MFGSAKPNPFAERREPTIGPPGIMDDARDPEAPRWWQQSDSGVSSFAGPTVSPDSAMRHSAVFACVRLIAGSIAGMPAHIYKPGKDGDRTRAGNHPLDWILSKQPNAAMTARVFWEYMVTAELLKGDSVAIIDRPSVYSADITGLIPVNPDFVEVVKVGDRRRFWIYTDDGKRAAFDQDDIFHVPGPGYDGLRGKSVIRWAARQSIGTGLAAAEYAGRYFSQGARPDVVITYPKKVDDVQADLIRKYWLKKHQGLANSHMPAVLSEDAKVTTLGISPKDSMLLDEQKFSVIDIARAFGVPPVMIGETEKTSSWGSGVEEMARQFVVFGLDYHLTKYEQEADCKLVPSGRFYTEFTREKLLQGDTKTRTELYGKALGSNNGPGWMTVNEVRQRENMPKIDGGDELYRPQTSGGSGGQPAPSKQPAPNPAQPAPQPPTP